MLREIKGKQNELCRSDHSNHFNCVNRRRRLNSRELHQETAFDPYQDLDVDIGYLDKNLEWFEDYYPDFVSRNDTQFITTIEE